MKIFIGGVNGSGKSTLLENFIHKNPTYRHIRTSMEFAKWLEFDNDYEKLRALPDQERDEKLEEFMNQLLDSSDNLLIDSHYLNLVRGKVTETTRDWISKCDAMVLVTTDTQTIWNRIKNDTRDRALFPEDYPEEEKLIMLEDYIDKYEKTFANLAHKYNLPNKKILNYNLDSATTDLEEFLSTIN